ncbi:MAG: hypothetical protein Q4A32_12180 [Lachnospiraceae bacterium]|nr:hypothetical protein [Lachnospiraceae bacterium]
MGAVTMIALTDETQSKMKTKYEELRLEVIIFESADIITDSIEGGGNGGNGEGGNYGD